MLSPQEIISVVTERFPWLPQGGAKHDARQLADRKAKVAKLADLRREEAVLRRKSDADLATLKAAVDAAQQALTEASQRLTGRKRRYIQERAPIAMEATRLEAALRSTHDPLIGEAISRIDHRWEKVRHRPSLTHREETGLHYVHTGKPEFRLLTNFEACCRLSSAVLQAKEDLLRLKLEAPDDVVAAIAEIEARLPWSDVERLPAA